jgi:hypothetical protein
MIVKANKFGRYQCPCCAYYAFRQEPTGEYDICTICYWEDDPFQLADPTNEEGANSVSLHQAQQYFKNSGISDPQYSRYARKPSREELPD